MKISKYIAALFVALLVVPAAVMAAKGPHLSFADGHTSVDMGVVYVDSVASREVKIVNTGDSALVLFSIFSDCRCSWAEYPKTPIEPGDTATVKVFYSAFRMNPGGFVKGLRIRSNADKPLERLLLRGDVDRVR